MVSTVGRPKEHGEQTGDALLAAAERILESEGLHAVSIRRLADEVGTTTRAVYSIFGSKEGLLVALAANAFHILREKVDGQRLTNDPSADFAKVGLAFRSFALEHPALFRLAVQRDLPDPALYDQYAASAAKALDRLQARAQRFVESAGIDADHRVVAAQYHALCEGLAALELRRAIGPPKNAEKIWRGALATLVAGFVAQAR